MKEYAIEITETLSLIEYVEADSEEDALDLIRAMYFNEEIILDSSNYIATDFQIYEE